MTRTNMIVTVTLVMLFSAGSAAAAVALAVYSKDIVDGEVKTVDLATKAVTTKKLAANAVDGTKLDESTLGIVPNTDQLDGRDSTSFLAGAGRIVAGNASFSRGTMVAIFGTALADEIGFNVAYQCPGGSPSVPAKIEFRDRSSAGWDVWYQDGGDDPYFVEVLADATTEFAANQERHSIKFVMRSKADGSQATLVYSLTGLPTTCKTAGLATLFN